MLLSVIMPVHNERGTIREIISLVMALPVDKELIIVDDASTDGTRDILTSLSSSLRTSLSPPVIPSLRSGRSLRMKSEESPAVQGDSSLLSLRANAVSEAISNIKILFHDKNKGKGAAIRTGIAEATGEFTVIQDADLEYDPHDLLSLLEPALSGDADVVYGSRFRGEYSDFSTLHWWGNKFLTFAANLIYGSRLSDVETCYKLFRTSVLKSIKLRAERFDFEPEVTAKLLRRGIAIAEVPISYAGRKFTEGKKITWRDGFSALRTLIKYRFVS